MSRGSPARSIPRAEASNLVVHAHGLFELLFAVIPKIGPQPEDVCATALQGARI